MSCANASTGLQYWQNLVEKVNADDSKEQGEEHRKQKAGIGKQQVDQENGVRKERSFFSSLD